MNRRWLAQRYFGLVDALPAGLRRRLVASPALTLYRRVAVWLGSEIPPGLFRIQAGPLAGRWLYTGSAAERGYPSVRLYLAGTYEPAVSAALRQFCPSGGVVCDIGAHLGYFTLLMADAVGTEGMCISFEPHSANCAMIRQTVAYNGVAHVRLEQAAVADCQDALPFAMHANSLMGHLATDDAAAHGADVMALETVPVWTLDAYWARHEPGRLSLAKIDVEGAEVAVLQGAHETLSRSRPILLIEVHAEPDTHTGAEIGRILRSLNYELWQLEAGRVLQPGEQVGGHILARPLEP